METDSSLVKVNQLVTELAEAREKKDRIKIESAKAQAEIDTLEMTLLNLLEASNLTSFKGENGSVVVAYRSSVKIPREPDAKDAFFQYLRDVEMFDSLISVNSQTLNSFYKSQEELALKNGTIDFTMPGIERPTPYPEIRFSKAK